MRARWLVLLLSLLVGTACEHPIPLTTGHVEAMEMVVRDSLGQTLATTRENVQWIGGPLLVGLDRARPLRISFLDIHGKEFDLGARADLSIRLEAEDGVSVTWEHLGAWGYLHPHRLATTRVRFLVWHGDHPDFISPWIPVQVTPTLSVSGASQ